MREQYLKEWNTFIHHKRFAMSTYRTYSSSVEWFLKRAGDDPKELTYHEIRTILLEVKEKNSVNSIITAIRQFYLHIFNRELDYRQLPYTKKQHRIQPIYSHEEAMRIFNHITNEKQKALLALTIDQGLRISEPCNILLSDCSIDDQRIILRSAKGDADRTIYPSRLVWDLMEAYINVWHTCPVKYLFEGEKSGNPYTASSIRGFVRRHCELSNTPYKKVHAFRRYSITWSHENGAALGALARRSGHKTTRTIEKSYLYHSEKFMRGVISPFQNSATD